MQMLVYTDTRTGMSCRRHEHRRTGLESPSSTNDDMMMMNVN